MRPFWTDDLGMDLLLGGGWRLVERLPAKESATVLVRGGPGAGKTLVAFQAAVELAKALGGDVLVACVEILPTEYRAQLVSARPDVNQESVVVLPTSSQDTFEDGPRCFIGLLSELDPDAPDLVAGVESLQREVASLGGKPVVTVVDSLIDGYGLGASAPRVGIDAVMKFAAQAGQALVLCEEAGSPSTSPWVFAVDTVLELSLESREPVRRIEIRKNRFGVSAFGQHEFEIPGRGHPRMFPEPHAWIALGHQQTLAAHGWTFTKSESVPRLALLEALSPRGGTESSFEGRLALITSPESGLARTLALGLVPKTLGPQRDLIVQLDPLGVEEHGRTEPDVMVRWLPTIHGPARAVRKLLECFHEASVGERPLRRIVLGDLGSVLTDSGHGWTEALHAFSTLVAESGRDIPVIAYEGRGHFGKTVPHTVATKYADLLIEVEWGPNASVATTAAVRGRWARETRQLVWSTRIDEMPLQGELAALDAAVRR